MCHFVKEHQSLLPLRRQWECLLAPPPLIGSRGRTVLDDEVADKLPDREYGCLIGMGLIMRRKILG